MTCFSFLLSFLLFFHLYVLFLFPFVSLSVLTFISLLFASRSLYFHSFFLVSLCFPCSSTFRYQLANPLPCPLLSDHPEGGQADGAAGRRRPRLPAPQVCLLPEGHRTHVPVSFPRKDHPVSSQCHSHIATHHFRVAVVSRSVMLFTDD